MHGVRLDEWALGDTWLWCADYYFRNVSLGKAFGQRLVEALATSPTLAILDGDLAASGGFGKAIGHARYYEMGVSEQV
jgi:transketolase C-terminal domain/subunit